MNLNMLISFPLHGLGCILQTMIWKRYVAMQEGEGTNLVENNGQLYNFSFRFTQGK